MTFPIHAPAAPAAQRSDSGPAPGDRAERGRVHLTPRERQIVHLVGCGCSNAEIAERLSLRPQTVKNRLSEIYEKTGSRNRVDLTLRAVRGVDGLELTF
jgi:DNA-binding NarL/FixJ family response regulator